MKIVVIVRTRDEEQNIGRFCESYKWASKILVADGGSVDRTVEIAKEFRNVEVRDFPIRVQMENGLWRNPHGAHINFLIDWAEFQEKADWIIFDDCDCFPNYLVKDQGRQILRSTDMDYVYITRLYLWGAHRHFPRLAQPKEPGAWEPSLWAWRVSTGIRFRADMPRTLQALRMNPPADKRLNLLPPHCLLHRAWPDLGKTQAKVDFYRNSGQIPTMLHPLEFGGELANLPEWAHE